MSVSAASEALKENQKLTGFQKGFLEIGQVFI